MAVLYVLLTVALAFGTTASLASACACPQEASAKHDCCPKEAKTEKVSCHLKHDAASKDAPSKAEKNCCCEKMAGCNLSLQLGAVKESALDLHMVKSLLPAADGALHSLSQAPLMQPPKA